MSTAHPESPTIVQDPAGPEGLVAELLARRRKRLPALTLALIVLVAAAAAFIGGVEVQKHFGKASATSGGLPSSVAAAFANGSFPGAAARGSSPGSGAFPGFGGANATTGTVTLIKGTTLYVTNAAGNTVLVQISARSRISKSVSSSVKTIHPGDSVTVLGSQNKNGSVKASQVTVGGGNG